MRRVLRLITLFAIPQFIPGVKIIYTWLFPCDSEATPTTGGVNISPSLMLALALGLAMTGGTWAYVTDCVPSLSRGHKNQAVFLLSYSPVIHQEEGSRIAPAPQPRPQCEHGKDLDSTCRPGPNPD